MEALISPKYRFFLLVTSFPFFVVWLILIFSIIYSNFLYVKISNISYEDLIKYKLLDDNVSGPRIIARDDVRLNLLLADSYAERWNYSVEKNSGIKNSSEKDSLKAIEFYKKAILSNPLSGESHLKLGIMYANLKMNREAFSELKKAALLDPKNAYQQFDVGRYFFKIKNYKDGSRILKEANTLSPQFLPESLNLVWDLTRDYQTLTNVTPEQQHAFLTLGNFLLKKEMWDEAIVVYKKAILLNPKNTIPYQSLSFAYEGKGMFDEALQVMLSGLKEIPENSDIYFYLGGIYLKKNELEDGIVNIRKAIKLCSNKFNSKSLIEYHLALSEIYFNRMKYYEKSLEEADSVLKINSTESRAYFLKGLCYKSMNSNPDKMIDCFKKAVIYSPHDLKYRFTLAENYYLYGLYKEALAEWEEIGKLSPREELVEKKIREINEAMKKDLISIVIDNTK
ncbi:MAG: hypothetical protein A3G31_00310 [Candidatus Schekmanbacteria bacterium RIFCSPLOWO2_12_FULL_38_15]|uniref:Uncharacterized protein n=1 Tax=Candidatus Schekmanbacteria bacterium RIFCSPLOWO2_12_FULL_38_15 TaxID=1817883 RepID=A0A1F7SGA1_9BACT|nr:MAG: hypothetical protein A3G31_00310 [Candidatus Schekmanbacteria bacterium RIFCSPLOWO2_12_FULL_38_15]